jgi:hypothetical protein
MNKVLIWLTSIFALISQSLNVLILFGHHDMTISARCYINRKKKYWRTAYKVVNKIFFFQENHCKVSFQSDIDFAKEVIEIEEEQDND